MKKLIALIAIVALLTLKAAGAKVAVGWDFEFCVCDTLEVCHDLNNPDWEPVPGPYHLTDDKVRYRVILISDGQPYFFRVSRVWGSPMVMPEELPTERTEKNSVNCHD
jgi:hypothetical protein